MSRFIRLLPLLLCLGCSNNPDTIDPDPPADPFIIWAELLDGVEASSADLEFEAERLVAAGDWAPIVEFVRDQFTTLPAGVDDLGNPSRVLAGPRAILRSGAGTARDKAELVFDLLSRAGYAPERRLGNVPTDRAYWDAVLAPAVHNFEPVWSESLIARGRADLAAGPLTRTVVDADGAQAETLAQALLTALNGNLILPPFDYNSPPLLPLVMFDADGETRHGNVFDRAVAAGEPGTTTGTSIGTGSPAAFPGVTISLSVVTSAQPQTPIVVATQTWTIDALVGRQVGVQFVPALDPDVALDLPANVLSDFVPVLSMRGHDMSAEDIDAQTFFGNLVSIRGDVMRFGADDTLAYRHHTLTTDESADPGAVGALEMNIISAAFPTVTLQAAALDASDQPVVGLAAAAFRVLEDGAPLPFTLLQNDAGAPRVLFVLDKSSGMPPDYQGAQLATLARSVAADIQALDAAAEFRAHMVEGSTFQGEWTTDLDAFEFAVTDQVGGATSDLWATLSDASNFEPTLVIMISDGAATDEPSSSQLAAIDQLGPSLFVEVGTPLTSIYPELIARIGGETFAPQDQSEIGPRALAYINAAQRNNYVFKYTAPLEGNTTRTVTLEMRDNSAVTTSGPYDPPSNAVTPALLRAELTLELNGDSVTRVLAGDQQPPDPITPEYVARVRRELLSANLLGFEASDPTPSALVKDVLRNKLNAQPFYEAAEGGDEAVARQVILEGGVNVPVSLLAALRTSAAPSVSAPLFATGVRIALHRRVLGVDAEVESIDVLPFGGVASAADNSDARLLDALRVSARTAVIESELFEESTRAVVAGGPLSAGGPGVSVAEMYPQLQNPALIARWQRALAGHQNAWIVFPQSPDTVAFWSVNAQTGSVLGILENGSGGGSTASLEAAIEALNMLDLASAGVGGSAQLGFWVSLSKAILKQAIRATIAILNLGIAPPPPGGIEDAVSEMACDAIKDEAYGLLGGTGEVLDILDAAMEMLTGDGVPCPGL